MKQGEKMDESMKKDPSMHDHQHMDHAMEGTIITR